MDIMYNIERNLNILGYYLDNTCKYLTNTIDYTSVDNEDDWIALTILNDNKYVLVEIFMNAERKIVYVVDVNDDLLVNLKETIKKSVNRR